MSEKDSISPAPPSFSPSPSLSMVDDMLAICGGLSFQITRTNSQSSPWRLALAESAIIRAHTWRRNAASANSAMAEMGSMKSGALAFKILAECPVSKARAAVMTLPHAAVDTPVFMPVGTQGTLKGMTPHQLETLDCRILLGNTYHLGNRPVGGHVRQRLAFGIS